MMRSDSLNDLLARASQAPHGHARAALWAEAAALAEEEGMWSDAVLSYANLCSAYQSAGDITRVIAPFMWLDRTRRERPELFTASLERRYAWFYKFVLAAVEEVPTIPVAQWQELLERMRTHYAGLGDSMRAYYYLEYSFHYAMGNTEQADQAFARWMSAGPSDLDDCIHCAPSYVVAYYAERGQWERALVAGEEALEAEGRRCDSQPEGLLCEMLEAWLRQGEDSQAWAAHVRAYRRHQRAVRAFGYLHMHLRYLALSGAAGRPQRLQRGVTILCRHMPWITDAGTPRMLRQFAVAAFNLLHALPSQMDEQVLPITLPGGDLRWGSAPALVDPTVAQTREWMRNLALDIADAYDARPGNEARGLARERCERELYPEPLSCELDPDLMEDVTGMGDYRSALTFLPEERAGVEPEVDTGADAQVGVGAPSPFVPLPLHGPWETMSVEELLSACATEGHYVPSIFFYTLRERIWRDPDLLAAEYGQTLPPELVPTWEWACYMAAEAMVVGMGLELAPIDSQDEAFRFLNGAQEALEKDEEETAWRFVQDALRTPGQDPVGVRLRGLELLADILSRSDNTAMIITLARERANLAARMGLPVEQALASSVLTSCLLADESFDDAAEVARNALDLLESYSCVDALVATLYHYSAIAHIGLGEATEAAECFRHAAERHRGQGNGLSACDLYRDAGRALLEQEKYAESLPFLEESCEIGRRSFDRLLASYREAVSDEQAQHRQVELAHIAQSRARSLYLLALTISWQPGSPTSEELEAAEKVMEELHDLVTSEVFEELTSVPLEHRHAQWSDQMAEVYINSGRDALAMPLLEAAIIGFQGVGDTQGQAHSLMSMARVHHNAGARGEALETAQQALLLLSDVSAEDSPLKSHLEMFCRELSGSVDKEP